MTSPRHRRLVALALLLAAAPAAAQHAPVAPVADPGAPNRSEAVPEIPALQWSDGLPRPFLAGLAEVGTTEHLRLMAGYGQPFWLWGGLIVDGWVNLDMATGTAGARLALLLVNLDVHYRVTRNFDRVPMAPAPSHTEVAGGGASTNRAWDLDLWGVIPTPGGYAAWEAFASRLVGLPSDVQVFDEGVHAIVQPPWSGFASLGWVANLRGGDLQVGGSGELTYLGRGHALDDLRLRAGPLLLWSLTPRWTLRGQILFTLASPDALPLWTSLGGGLAIGYRDATGTTPR